MKLYIGGAGYGQEIVAEKDTGIKPVLCSADEALHAKAIDKFHLITKELSEKGVSIQDYTKKLVAENPDAVICSDEIGGGVHPADIADRLWREETGRALCIIASASDAVIRVYCGIGQKIK